MSKIKKVQAPDGTIIKVEGPDDATDEQFIQQGQTLYQQQKQPGKIATPPPAGGPAPTIQPQINSSILGSQLLGADPSLLLERAGGVAGRVINRLLPGGSTPRPNATLPDMTPQEEIGGKVADLAGLASGVQGLGSAIAKRLPSKVRAGETLNQIGEAAKNVPSDLTEVNSTIARAKQLRAAGHGQLSQGMTKISEAQEPIDIGGGAKAAPEPLTYGPQGERPGTFDAASAAKKLASEERANMTGMMENQVKEFARALQTANREAAAKVGMGEMFDQAMNEYRQAKGIEDAAQIAKKWIVRVALTGTGIGVAGKIAHEIYSK